jgi:hypothetical protein
MPHEAVREYTDAGRGAIFARVHPPHWIWVYRVSRHPYPACDITEVRTKPFSWALAGVLGNPQPAPGRPVTLRALLQRSRR